MSNNLIGVYFIRNIINGMMYVGHSKNIDGRLRAHKSYLNRNIHHCIPLQRAWNKYGCNNFIFEIYKICETENKSIECEQLLIDELTNLYNTSKLASLGGDLISQNPNRDNIISKIRLSTQKNMSTLSEEERKEKFGQPGFENPMFGKNHSNKTKTLISKKNKGKIPINKGRSLESIVGLDRSNAIKLKLSAYAKSRTGENNSFFGKKHSTESKKKISISKKGQKPPNMREVSIEFEIYESLTAAARSLNISPATILYRIRSKNDLYKNYVYIK